LKNSVIPRVEKQLEKEKTHAAYEEKAFFHKMVGDYFRYASEAVSS